MPRNPNRRSISLSRAAYDKLKNYCDENQLSYASVVEAALAELTPEMAERAKTRRNRPHHASCTKRDEEHDECPI